MATNPYDRRMDTKRRASRAGETVDVGGYAPFDLLADGRRAYPGFSLGRLEDLLRDEFARGFNAGEGTMERRHEEEILPRVQRQAWAEGREAGASDGRAELLTALAEQFETRANELLESLGAALESERTTRALLRECAGAARDLLAEMVKAHHNEFRGEMPF